MKKKSVTTSTSAPVLLSGGNPQIPKGYGEAPVHAYIAALADWKQHVVRQIDALITDAYPTVQKAVKWNSPLYGHDEQHFIISMHVFAKYVKVAFMNGSSLTPLPPGESKQANVRYLDVRETDTLNETQFKEWVKQASKLEGAKM